MGLFGDTPTIEMFTIHVHVLYISVEGLLQLGVKYLHRAPLGASSVVTFFIYALSTEKKVSRPQPITVAQRTVYLCQENRGYSGK